MANVSTVDIADPKDLVRRGYDAVSLRYDEMYGAETKYQSLLGDLCRQIPAGGTVLDLGCGGGVPVARTLAAAGYRVTGIDISEVQIRRARERCLTQSSSAVMPRLSPSAPRPSTPSSPSSP